jgi:hypothetical protein
MLAYMIASMNALVLEYYLEYLAPEYVSFQKVGEDGVFAGGFAARKHPTPKFTEMIPEYDEKMMETIDKFLNFLKHGIGEKKGAEPSK